MPPPPAAPTYRVSSYTVFPSAYDKVTDPGRSQWCLTVADAGDGWAIRRGTKCLNFTNRWEDEMPPELSDSAFRHRCRYNEHAALMRARRVVDRLEVQGLTFEEFAFRAQGADPQAPTGPQG